MEGLLDSRLVHRGVDAPRLHLSDTILILYYKQYIYIYIYTTILLICSEYSKYS